MIRLENIAKYYYSPSGVGLGLKNINLTFERGEFVIITGESGSGKTTLLNVISGMDTFEEGEMYLSGEPVSAMDDEFWEGYRKNHISFIYQDYKLIESYTSLENVESVLLLRGYDKKKAKKMAEEYLEQVGLSDRKKSRAAQLSSGQKQRLAIARALAKGTEIIIADEPTGNLDVENGRMVMKMLAEFSKTRLVLVVTHNYEQAGDLATRMIRLYGGQVSEDIRLRGSDAEGRKETQEPAAEERPAQSERKEEPEKRRKTNKRQRPELAFLNMNLHRQPVRNAVFFLLCLCLSASFLVFIGMISQNLDQAQAMQYQENEYYNRDDTRILIRNRDGSALTEEDFAAISQVKYVAQTERYADISDINYYFRYGEDYEFEYITSEDSFYQENLDYKEIVYLDNAHYMKSVSCLSEEDLSAGRLPEGLNEIVVTSKDKSLIGTTINVICADRRNWKESTYVREDMIITGIVNGDGDQFYFSDRFSDILAADTIFMQPAEADNSNGASYSDGNFSRSCLITGFVGDVNKGVGPYDTHLDECLNWLELYYNSEQDEIGFPDKWNEVERWAFNVAVEPLTSGGMICHDMLLLVDDSLKGTEILLSTDFYERHVCSDNNGIWVCRVPYNALFGIWNEETGRKDYYHLEVRHEKIEDGSENGVYSTTEKQSGLYSVYVSPEFYDTIFPDRHIAQAAVYIRDYAYTDRVIKQLADLGYGVISVFRISSVGYDKETVISRLISVCIAAAALCVLFILGVLLLVFMMKAKQTDDTILHSLGMEKRLVRTVNHMYFGVMLLSSGLVSVILMYAVSAAGMKKVDDLQKYFQWYQFLAFAVILLFMAWLLGRRYMRLWNREWNKSL